MYGKKFFLLYIDKNIDMKYYFVYEKRDVDLKFYNIEDMVVDIFIKVFVKDIYDKFCRMYGLCIVVIWVRMLIYCSYFSLG